MSANAWPVWMTARELYEDINYCEKIIEDGSLIRAVEEALGAEIEY